MQNSSQVTKCLVLTALNSPVSDKSTIGTHERYKYPKLTVEEKALAPLSPNNVRLRMKYVGVCGTDVHLTSADPITGYVQSSAPAFIPPLGRVIGHEGVGEVISVGTEVKHLAQGMMVAPESIVSCGLCVPCRRGMFNQCSAAKLIGMETDGIFAEICDLPAKIVQPIGKLQNTEDGLIAAALLEPAGVAYLACENAKISPSDRVLVMGAGPIGLLSAIISKNVFGASHVSIIEKSDFRRSFAAQWCDEAFSPDNFDTKANGFHALIEASGALDDAMSHIARIVPNGRICLLARNGQPAHIREVDHIISNNISIIGCRGHLGGVFERIISLIAVGRLPIHEIVTSIASDLGALKDVLNNPRSIVEKNCKVLCKIA